MGKKRVLSNKAKLATSKASNKENSKVEPKQPNKSKLLDKTKGQKMEKIDKKRSR